MPFHKTNSGEYAMAPVVVFRHQTLVHTYFLPLNTDLSGLDTPFEVAVAAAMPVFAWLIEQGIPYCVQCASAVNNIAGFDVVTISPVLDLDSDQQVIAAKLRWP